MEISEDLLPIAAVSSQWSVEEVEEVIETNIGTIIVHDTAELLTTYQLTSNAIFSTPAKAHFPSIDVNLDNSLVEDRECSTPTAIQLNEQSPFISEIPKKRQVG